MRSMPTADAFHHVTLTVTDLARSVAWYERVLQIPVVAEREGDGWRRTLLRGPPGLAIGLTCHDDARPDDRFDHRRVGLDHLSIACTDREALEGWEAHLDAIGVAHEPLAEHAYGTTLVARDPDGIPVEFFWPV